MGIQYDDFHSYVQDKIAEAEIELARAQDADYHEGMSAAFAKKMAYEDALAFYSKMDNDSEEDAS